MLASCSILSPAVLLSLCPAKAENLENGTSSETVLSYGLLLRGRESVLRLSSTENLLSCMLYSSISSCY